MSGQLGKPKQHGHCLRGLCSAEYRAWQNMKSRCLNSKHGSFKNYGGRGILICARWLESFENFFADVGARPSAKHSIDRINNNGNYEPGNVRWATSAQQRANTRPPISPHGKKRIDMTGQRFCRLVVLQFSRRAASGHHYWLCRCDCGSQREIMRTSLVDGRTKSCGCLHDEISRKPFHLKRQHLENPS